MIIPANRALTVHKKGKVNSKAPQKYSYLLTYLPHNLLVLTVPLNPPSVPRQCDNYNRT